MLWMCASECGWCCWFDDSVLCLYVVMFVLVCGVACMRCGLLDNVPGVCCIPLHCCNVVVVCELYVLTSVCVYVYVWLCMRFRVVL